jgi:hypothetical protein
VAHVAGHEIPILLAKSRDERPKLFILCLHELVTRERLLPSEERRGVAKGQRVAVHVMADIQKAKHISLCEYYFLLEFSGHGPFGQNWEASFSRFLSNDDAQKPFRMF